LRNQLIALAAFCGWIGCLVAFAEWCNRRAGEWQSTEYEALAQVPALPPARACAEESLSLTGDSGMSWAYGSLAFQGKATVVTCAGGAAKAVAEKREQLLAELSRAVDRNGFRMPFVCRPEWAEKQAGDFGARQRQLILAFNRVAGIGVVRRLECSFGWVHTDDDGKVVSGAW
jgi:hypothetical protein